MPSLQRTTRRVVTEPGITAAPALLALWLLQAGGCTGSAQGTAPDADSGAMDGTIAHPDASSPPPDSPSMGSDSSSVHPDAVANDAHSDAATTPGSDASVPDATPPSGTPIIVVAGYNVRRVSSTNGTTWQEGTPGPDTTTTGDNIITGLAYGNGVVVATAHHGVMTSTDGMNWTAESGPAMGGSAAAFFDNQFVALVGEVTYNSPDGTTWASHTDPGGGYQSPDWAQHWNGIASGNGHLLVVGDRNCVGGGSIKVSEDGTTWHDYNNEAVSWRAVTYGNGVFVAAGDFCNNGATGRRAVGTDGVHWTEMDDSTPGAAQVGSVTGVAFANGSFLLCGANQCAHSTDGMTWSVVAGSQDPPGGSLFFANGMFYALSWQSNIWASPDGSQWTQVFGSNDTGPAFQTGALVRVPQ